MPISTIVQNEMLRAGNWPNWWRQKVSRFCNFIKIQWIDMVVWNKVVHEEFKILLVKMGHNMLSLMSWYLWITSLWPWDHNGAYLYDPYVGSFARFEQVCLNWKTFICNFVSNVKLCQGNLHNMYCCNEEKYNCTNFPQFEIFIEHAFDPLHILWWNNLVIGV